MNLHHYHWYNAPLQLWQVLLACYLLLLLTWLMVGIGEKRSGRLSKTPSTFRLPPLEDEYVLIAGFMVIASAGVFFFHFDAPWWLALLEGLPVGILLFLGGAVMLEAGFFAVFWLLKKFP